MSRAVRLAGTVFTVLGGMLAAVGAGLLVLLLPPAIGLIFCALGIVFLLVGGGLLTGIRAARQRRARLLERGLRVDASIVEVAPDRRCSINRRYPWVIRCQAPDPETGRVSVFQSDGFWFDPAPFLAGHATLSVYVQPGDPRRYVVDTTGIVPPEDWTPGAFYSFTEGMIPNHEDPGH